jgi:hypothetical protein
MKDGVTVRLSLAQIYALTAATLADGAPETLDTLNELAAALGDDPNFAATTATALGNRLRFDAPQSLTNGQKSQALGNRLRFDAPQSLTNGQKSQALANLGGDALSPDFIQGLVLSNNSGDANNRVDIGAGRAKGGVRVVINASTMTKRLDAVWAAGSGNGGLDTGSKAPGATYHVHSITNNSTGAFDALFSLSAAAPSVPSGWSTVQRLGAVVLDASANIRPFRQRLNWFILKSPVDDYTGGQRAMAPLALTVPNGVPVRSKHGVYISVRTGSDSVVSSLLADGEDSSAITARLRVVGSGIPANEFWAEGSTNTSRQINASFVLVSGTQSANHVITTLGWEDYTIPRLA